jgi:hypothetical protein
MIFKISLSSSAIYPFSINRPITKARLKAVLESWKLSLTRIYAQLTEERNQDARG